MKPPSFYKSILDPRLDIATPAFGGTLLAVTFKAGVDDAIGAVILHVDPEKKTYRVGSSSTANTKTFKDVADAYNRAARFISMSELTPA